MNWHIGNTTVRTPYRLRDALRVLSSSQLHGRLSGRENESAFADLLHEQGVVNVWRRESGEEKDYSDLGRKWRSALTQLGFLSSGFGESADYSLRPFAKNRNELRRLLTLPYTITPLGTALIQFETTTAQHDVFLRSLAGYRIPSKIEPRYSVSQFSPLRWVLAVQLALESIGESGFVSLVELGTFIQLTNPQEDDPLEVANSIRLFRARRADEQGSLKRFDSLRFDIAAGHLLGLPHTAEKAKKRGRTLRDYADLSARYLKSTGLFATGGRSIGLVEEKRAVAEALANEQISELDDINYVNQLWFGAPIPTDDRATAESVIATLRDAIVERGGDVNVVDLKRLVDGELELERHTLEDRLAQLNEQEFATIQPEQSKEISLLMNLILKGGGSAADGDSVVNVPKSELPAYFEWVIWRAFLATNAVINRPWEARRFQIDQDILPITHAPGGGPDMSFVFEETILVVEVTLTSSSRQEAAEGEPVRRHVAQFAERDNSGKSIYGLFIAPEIDTNTAHTFKSGDWYRRDDSKINVHIVPIRLEDFRSLFEAILSKASDPIGRLVGLLTQCRMEAVRDAPEWKKFISELISNAAKSAAT